MPARAPLDRLIPDRPSGGWRSFLRRATRSVFRALADVFSRNNLLTYASAIAFQVLIAVVALVLLGLALIDLLAFKEIWRDNVRPFIEERFLFETYLAIDTTVEKIFASGSALLLAFAAALATWEVSGAIRAVSGALNEIYETEEDRGVVRRFGTSLVLAVVVILCIVGAVFSANLVPRIGSIPSALGQLIGWMGAIVLLVSVVWLLLRYAPAKTRSVGWTSVGSVFVVVAWIAASLLYGYYVQNVANYRTATGNLLVLITLTGYLYTSSIIFLTGAQLDELLRKQATRGNKGLEALTTLHEAERSSS